MVGHAKQFRLFTDVKVITEILRVVLFAHFVNPCRQKLACAIGCYLVQHVYAAICKKFSGSTNRMEHKRKVVEPEGFFVVITI